MSKSNEEVISAIRDMLDHDKMKLFLESADIDALGRMYEIFQLLNVDEEFDKMHYDFLREALRQEREWSLHEADCCADHGCVHESDDCPVINGQTDSHGPCGDC